MSQVAAKKHIIRERWGSLPIGTDLLPPDLEPGNWSTAFAERLARLVKTGIPHQLGERALRKTMQDRIARHVARRVSYIEGLSPGDVAETISRVFPAGTHSHLELSKCNLSISTITQILISSIVSVLLGPGRCQAHTSTGPTAFARFRPCPP